MHCCYNRPGGMCMGKQWQRILAAFLLGLMVPGLTAKFGVQIADPMSQIQILPPETSGEPTSPQDLQNSSIPVLLLDGQVISMEMEVYIVGVVLAEMPASFELEALKAQAVVARTYAMKRVAEGLRHTQGAVCVDPGCCQAYITPEEYQNSRGTLADVLKVTAAVEATAGQVLTYEGQLAEATYFSCSGGRTEDAAAVWGTTIPYLQAVDSPGEEQALPYKNTVSFTREEFAEALGRNLLGDPQNWLGMVTYTPGGGVATMVVAGVSYTGVRLRQLLNLNSTAFTMTVSDGKIWITTLGKGHRVGMSQYGAEAMAVTGSTCDAILAHYYPGTKIDKIGAIG